MKLKRLHLVPFFICSSILLSCNKDDDSIANPQPDENLNQILTFQFLAEDNEALTKDYTADIDQDKRHITISSMPNEISRAFLIPKIKTTVGSLALPASGSAQDFTNPVLYEVASDSNNSNTYTVIIKNDTSENRMLSFAILAQNNINMNTDIVGDINHDTNTITLDFPQDLDLKNLIPSIELFDVEAAIAPQNGELQNFTEPVTYTVTAKNGSKRSYTVKSSGVTFSDNKIVSFAFLKTENQSLPQDYTALIDDQHKVIILELPEGIDVNSLTPSIETSPGATINLSANRTHYEVRSEDGKLQKYLIDIYNPNSLGSDRHALLQLYYANQEKLTNWDIFESVDRWNTGRIVIEPSNNRVSRLAIDLSQISDQTPLEVPENFGLLKELKFLSLVSCGLTDFPEEILEITGLLDLYLHKNLIKSLPEDIDKLATLRFFDLRSNRLETIPETIENLEKLQILHLNINLLASLPGTIANLGQFDFIALNIENNPIIIDQFPKEICDLKNKDSFIFTHDEGVCP